MKRSILLAILALAGMLFVPGARCDNTELPPYIPSVLVVDGDDAVAQLEAKGVIVWHRRGDMVLCAVPRELDDARRVRGVRREERGRRCVPTLDVARQWHGTDRLATGAGLVRPYTGSGVVTGFCDTGFDPNHIAFLDADGNSRVRLLVAYDEPNGERTVVDTPEGIASWTTDNVDEFHGTHVANIMAGGFRDGLYYGLAPDADIVATTSQLYDAGLLSACEDIVDYAKSVGKPAVINLSVGSYNGPHDGSSLFCRYMDMLAEDAIVCLSAGNEGQRNNTFRAAFTEDFRIWRTRTMSGNWMQFDMNGMIDAWSHDTRPVGISFLIRDNVDSSVYYRHPLQSGESEFAETINLSAIPEVGGVIEGEVYLAGYVSDLNGRWVTEAIYDTHTDIDEPGSDGRWARYELAFEFSGEPGVSADIFGDGNTALRQWAGYVSPNSNMSISDLCTGENTISVGMMTTRYVVPTIEGEPRVTSWIPDVVCVASSYGTLIDGRVLPLTTAPGVTLVSACNSHYVEARPEVIPSLQAVTEVDGKKYYWAECGGTSMSCPYTAGVIACWLEANPNLSVADVQRIIGSTNVHDIPDPTNPRHGQGWLDPYEGLKMVVSDTGVSAPGSIDTGRISATIRNGVVEVLNPGAHRLMVNVFSVAGSMPMPSYQVDAPVSTLDVSGLPSGAYVVVISSESGEPYALKFVR